MHRMSPDSVRIGTSLSRSDLKTSSEFFPMRCCLTSVLCLDRIFKAWNAGCYWQRQFLPEDAELVVATRSARFEVARFGNPTHERGKNDDNSSLADASGDSKPKPKSKPMAGSKTQSQKVHAGLRIMLG